MTEHENAALRWIPLLPLFAAALSGAWLVFARRELPRAAVIALACGAPIASFAMDPQAGNSAMVLPGCGGATTT